MRRVVRPARTGVKHLPVAFVHRLSRHVCLLLPTVQLPSVQLDCTFTTTYRVCFNFAEARTKILVVT
jgi:hypothetical protein